MPSKSILFASLVVSTLTANPSLIAQTPATAAPAAGAPVPARPQLTPEQEAARKKLAADGEADHADMMRQLGITSLRPGADGDKNSPNAANFDENKGAPLSSSARPAGIS